MATPNAQGYFQTWEPDYGQMVWRDRNGNIDFGYTPPSAVTVPDAFSQPAPSGQPANLAQALQQQAGGADLMQSQWDQWTPDKWGTGLSPEMLYGITNRNWMTDPRADLSSRAGVASFTRDPNTGEIQYHPQGQGPGEDFYVYDGNTGKFLRNEKGSKVQSYASGIASVAGAALGMNALAGMAGGAAGGGGTFGAGGLGTGSPTGGLGYGFGGSTYGGSAIGSGIDFAAPSVGASGGAASFGLSPSIFTNPTLAEGAGLSTGAGSESLFSNPAMWSGSVPEGVGYGFTPSINFGLPAAGGGGGGGGSGGGGSSAPTSSGSPWEKIMNGDASMSDWLKLGSLGLGALAGSQGVNQSATSTRSMDPRMDQLFYGQLAPTTQGLLAGTTPQATAAGAQLMARGSGLLNTNLTPDVYNSPFYQGAANDLSMRTQKLLDQNNLGIQGNAVATGSLGGSRQGVAQGVAAGQAADYLQGNLGQLALGQYNQDATRNLQAVTLGAGLLDQGLQAPFSPAKQAASIYSPFTGFGQSTTSTSQGGGTMGAVGGAIGAYGAGKQLGWW